MRIREYAPADLEVVKRLHNGQSFELPNLAHPLVIVKKCLVDDDEQVRMAAFGRLHINAMLVVDPTWKGPAERLEAIAELQKNMVAETARYGIDIATTQMDARFAERMEALGWKPGFGRMFFLEV